MDSAYIFFSGLTLIQGAIFIHSLLLSFLFLRCKSEKAETRKLLVHRIFRLPIFVGRIIK